MGKRTKFNCIYVLLGPNKVAYVGQTTDPVNRKSRYKTLTCKNQRKVYGSLLLHGYDAHEFRVVLTIPKNATRQVMDFYENFFYELYQSQGYNMLNLKSPGWNGKPGEESCELMSKSRQGNKPWNTGTKGKCKAWNKGLSIARKSYTVIKNGETLKIDHLKNFCTDNNLNYTTMVHFLSGKGQYEKQTTFKGYERA